VDLRNQVAALNNKEKSMKTNITILLVIGMTLMGAASRGQNATGTKSADGAEALSYPNTPLEDVINNLAVLAGLNIQFDGRVTDSLKGPDGKPAKLVSIKWSNLTAREALSAVLDGNGLTAVTNPATPNVLKIAFKETNVVERLVLNVVPVRYANVTNLVTLIKPTLGARSQILPDLKGNKLVIASTESEYVSVSNLLAKLDTSMQQILIEAKFVETAKNPKSMKGIDWAGTLENQNLYFGNGITRGETTTQAPGATTTTGGAALPSGAAGTGTTTTPNYTANTLLNTVVGYGTGGLSVDTARGFFPHTAFLNADGAKAVLSFLNTENETEFIAQPRAVTMDGTQAELSSIRNIPVFEEEQGTTAQGIQQASTVKPNYNLSVGQTILNEVGIKLLVTPRVVGNSDVFLDLRPEISSVEGTERKLLGGKVNESPIFRRQKLNTSATVPSGNTLVLGGLLTDETGKAYSKVPVLGDIPAVGLLFRRDIKTRAKRNLLIFVTPTLVTDGDYQPTASNFLKSKSADKPDLDEPAWDTGAPASKYRPMF
jgi:type II secretory pathway component GspD/PulD (secretin)